MANFSMATTVIISGASRGLGKALCIGLAAKHLKPNSVMLLLGRSVESLEATKSEVMKVNDSVNVLIYAKFQCDAFDTTSFANFLEQSKATLSTTDALLIIHNAGTVGDPSQQTLKVDLAGSNDYMAVNFSSMVAANNILLANLDGFEHKTVVNISSLCAVQPVKCLGLYCAGMYVRC